MRGRRFQPLVRRGDDRRRRVVSGGADGAVSLVLREAAGDIPWPEGVDLVENSVPSATAIKPRALSRASVSAALVAERARFDERLGKRATFTGMVWPILRELW